MATLKLPTKKPDPLEVIVMDDSPEQAEFNSTIQVPTYSHVPDYSHLPPPGERGAQPVQAPAKKWGNPNLLRDSPRQAPQPLFTPKRGH